MAMNEQEQAFKDLTEAVANLLSKYESGERERTETINGVEKLRKDFATLQERLSDSAAAMDTTIGKLPKQLEVKLKHRFEGRTRIFAAIFMAALLIAAITTGLWWGSRRENRRLQKQGWQYRYVELAHPEASIHADSLYNHDPAAFRQMVERMEAERKAIEQAEAIARRKENEARRARDNVEKLKQNTR